jgi:glycosyltransferase involved in cell wall biosynthesis
MSRVDVIVPCYNYGHFLRQCVESVLSQSHQDLRVLVIDDCSPDHTEEVARELVARDERVTYRRHEVNRGHIATYNEGLDWAVGDYILLLSADDLLAPEALSRATRLMDARPEVGMTHGRALIIEEDGPPLRLPMVECRSTDRIVPGESLIEAFVTADHSPVSTPTVIVRADLQRHLGGYRPDLPHTGDMEMWMRFAFVARVGYHDEVQAYYRRHSANMHRRYSAVQCLEQRKAAFRVFFETHGHRVGDRERWKRMAYRRLGECAFWSAYHAFDRGEVEECEVLLQFARETWPPVRSMRSHTRLLCKMAIGPRAWSFIRSLRERTARKDALSPSGAG